MGVPGTVIDLASRRVVGWALADHMRAELVCDALRMAITHRRPAPGLIFHSDRGTQYTSSEFTGLLTEHEMISCHGRQCWETWWPRAGQTSAVELGIYHTIGAVRVRLAAVSRHVRWRHVGGTRLSSGLATPAQWRAVPCRPSRPWVAIIVAAVSR